LSKTIHTDKLFLTGADCFILALEKHNQLQGATGNTCRYVLELEGILDPSVFRKKINQNKILQQAASLSLHKGLFFSKPRWRLNVLKEIEVNLHTSDELIPKRILNKNFSITESNLFSFDVVHRSNGNSTLIMSWHHLLMDSFGACLLLKRISEVEKEVAFLVEEPKAAFNLNNIRKAKQAKRFIDKTSQKELSSIASNALNKPLNQKIRIMRFTEEETKLTEKNAQTAGAKFGLSPLYLGCAARAVKNLLMHRKMPLKDLWVPVPQNNRKKGASGPLVGNHISFLFYRLTKLELDSLHTCVTSVNNQMVSQIRLGLPKAYDVLLSFLKRIPSSLYYQLIKGPRGNSLASFLFTVAEEHPKDLMKFEGLRVLNALSLPPNNFKPGMTFAFMKFNNCLQIMMLSFEEILSETEMITLEARLKHELITGESLR
jgi:hypothetical protein